MATGFELARRGRIRDWLRGDAPASKGAQAFMFVSAMLCGAALSGLLFVGVWRHTAGEAATSKAAQQSDHVALQASRRTAATLAAKLAHEHALLAKANNTAASVTATLTQTRAALAEAKTALARTQAADAAKLQSATAHAASLSGAAGTLARTAAALRSELTALETYAQNPGPTGIDAGYLATQVRYLEASAASASTAASDLAQRAGALQR
jgi:hypothetical protein